MKQLKWNVLAESLNRRDIREFNIFEHVEFNRACRQQYQTHKHDFESFKAGVQRELMYYFRAKCEWEIIVSDWPPSGVSQKIDVYQQVTMNYDLFIDYVWNAYQTKTTKK